MIKFYCNRRGVFFLLCVLVIFSLSLTACSNSKESHSVEFNFIPEEYEEEYSEIEKEIQVNRGFENIYIETNLNQGKIDIWIYNPDGEMVKKMSADSENNIIEKIPVNKNEGLWKMKIKIGQDTDGRIRAGTELPIE
ncbi:MULTISPECIES: hypothetical protein [Caloranaerobacter]|uniref:Lipoprotein n=1 Tax=Caloranaerobacter azorensis DSM 13643 TaxID=1121264 RepID=A0A1M5WE97_9FIRM|nr:hypothetical protein [Caloranaerobacter azorensis]SHH85718.1 hypothetical protein SAMN02745135_02431 [Caloranaerobacter azorensis DSM 13643]